MHAYIFDGFPILEDLIRAVNLKGIFAGQIMAEKGYKKNERAPGKLLPIESVRFGQKMFSTQSEVRVRFCR